MFVAAEKQVVEAFELLALVGCESGAAEADDVEAADGVIAAGDSVGGEVFGDAGAALHEGEGADADELVDEAVAGDEGAVIDAGVAAEQCAICNDDPVADMRVVADMGVRHEEVVVAQAGLFGGIAGAMDCDVFADGVLLADGEGGGCAVVFEVLRGFAKDRSSEYLIGRADRGEAGDVDVGADAGVSADLDVLIDDGVGSDVNAGVKLGFGMDDSGGVDHV